MSFSTKKNNTKKSLLNVHGFTMIEMLIAITIFVVAITSATAIFIAVINAQSKSNAQRQTMQDGRYAMETITREVRMANGSIIQPAIKAENSATTSKLTVTTTNNTGSVITKLFEWSKAQGTITLTETRDGTITNNGVKITSDNIQVTAFKLENFLTLDQYDPSGGYGDAKKKPPRQPSVTITITTQQTSGHKQSATTLRTTISSRDYIY